MTNARPVDDDFLGSFSSASELERQFPAAHRSGMTATVTDGTTEHPYTCDGSTWKPVALYSTDSTGNVTGLVGPGVLQRFCYQRPKQACGLTHLYQHGKHHLVAIAGDW